MRHFLKYPARISSLISLFVLGFLFSSGPQAVSAGEKGIAAAEIFHDEGPLFCEGSQPDSRRPICLSIRCRRHDITRATLKYFDEVDHKYHLLPMKRASASDSSRYEYWQAKLPVGRSRKHYRFLLADGKSFVWYNAGGAYLSEPESGDFLVLPDFHTPAWLRDGVMYQIFADRFFDGDPSNNIKSNAYTLSGSATVQRSWQDSPLPQKGENAGLIFFGGDLSGILAKLSYIRGRVGANIVYLSPVFESPSNHKYDTSDYDRVAGCLGSNDTLIKLSGALHQTFAGQKGYLILDGVFNHTGDTHKWFGKYEYKRTSAIKGAYQSQASPFYSYYSFNRWPDEYATFLDVKSLPKLNYGSEALKNAIFKGNNSVALRYLQAPFNIDGWRLDAPQYTDKAGRQGSNAFNHELWREFRKTIKTRHPDALILGENWQDASAWIAGGDQFDSITNFCGFTEPVSEWITGLNIDDKPARLTVSEFDRWLRLTRAHYPWNARLCLSNHLSNHDISRFAQRAQGDPDKISLALAFQMTYVGVPTIYYGDEYGMPGGRDPDNRRTFDWSQDNADNRLLALTHRLIQLRNKYAALRSGSFLTLNLDDQKNIYAFGRMDRQNRIAVVLNADRVAHDTQVQTYKLEIPDSAFVTDALSQKRYQCIDGSVSLSLQPWQAAILIY